jgi:hypothetical protein
MASHPVVDHVRQRSGDGEFKASESIVSPPALVDDVDEGDRSIPECYRKFLEDFVDTRIQEFSDTFLKNTINGIVERIQTLHSQVRTLDLDSRKGIEGTVQLLSSDVHSMHERVLSMSSRLENLERPAVLAITDKPPPPAEDGALVVDELRKEMDEMRTELAGAVEVSVAALVENNKGILTEIGTLSEGAERLAKTMEAMQTKTTGIEYKIADLRSKSITKLENNMLNLNNKVVRMDAMMETTRKRVRSLKSPEADSGPAAPLLVTEDDLPERVPSKWADGLVLKDAHEGLVKEIVTLKRTIAQMDTQLQLHATQMRAYEKRAQRSAKEGATPHTISASLAKRVLSQAISSPALPIPTTMRKAPSVQPVAAPAAPPMATSRKRRPRTRTMHRRK